MGGNRQLCTSSAECPAAFPVCRAGGGGGQMTCRVVLDGGAGTEAGAAAEGGAPVDAASGG